MKNMTTIESWDFEDAQRRARRRGKKVRHMYDLGTCANLRTFFGRKALYWMVPTPASGDGVSFKTFHYKGTCARARGSSSNSGSLTLPGPAACAEKGEDPRTWAGYGV